MDPILFWNETALEANRASHTNGLGEQTGPPLSARALAIVHLAMHDALVVTDGTTGYAPYLPGLPAPAAGAAPAAAVAAAAHATLSALFPGQKPYFDARHAAAGFGGAGLREGHAFGLAVAAAMLADRRGDPGAGDDGYAASQARGAHRPDPDHPQQGFHAPFYGAAAKCFAVTARHALGDPPRPDPAHPMYPAYLTALRQVRAKGIAPHLQGTLPMGTAGRTPEEALIGVYWGYDGRPELGTPPRLYNQIIRQIAAARNETTARNARLFALVNAALGDAGILAWEQKYRHDLWRPVVGIREHDDSMGPTGSAAGGGFADCDPFWLPLGAPATNALAKNFTPPFPAYPSGHATFGAAALHITRRFYEVTGTGADAVFQDAEGRPMAFVSEEFNGGNRDNTGAVRPRHARTFPRGLWEMIEENGFSRVYLGVHWFFDAFALGKSGPDLSQNIGGVPLGLAIANDIFDSGLTKSTV